MIALWFQTHSSGSSPVWSVGPCCTSCPWTNGIAWPPGSMEAVSPVCSSPQHFFTPPLGKSAISGVCYQKCCWAGADVCVHGLKQTYSLLISVMPEGCEANSRCCMVVSHLTSADCFMFTLERIPTCSSGSELSPKKDCPKRHYKCGVSRKVRVEGCFSFVFTIHTFPLWNKMLPTTFIYSHLRIRGSFPSSQNSISPGFSHFSIGELKIQTFFLQNFYLNLRTFMSFYKIPIVI